MLDITIPYADTLPTIGVYAAFAILVVLPTLIGYKHIPDRIQSLRNGIYGILAAPFVLILLFVTMAAALQLAEIIPLLKWGWLGENIVVAPLTPDAATDPSAGTGTGNSGSTGEGSGLSTLLPFVLLPIIIVAMLIFNYDEEDLYRDSYKHVALWAALHLLMGIPIYAIIPIFCAGLVYKQIHDKYGLDTAYATHFATNALILSILLIAITLYAL